MGIKQVILLTFLFDIGHPKNWPVSHKSARHITGNYQVQSQPATGFSRIVILLSFSLVMMLLTSQPQQQVSSNSSEAEKQQIHAKYRGWSISTVVIDGQLWLRWQHPKESFSRYGCPITDEGMASTISHVRFLIDLAIKLEAAMPSEVIQSGDYTVQMSAS